MTTINAKSKFNRGDQVTLVEHPELGVFNIVDISATSVGVTNIKISRKFQKKDGSYIRLSLTDLRDADLKISKFANVTTEIKQQEFTLEV